ncbi:MAG TPA: GC-type dockerin domain-anchored protein [Phycisphaerales bacterium]|nr:GC-type dockerin domain-anchored protein [Phycisphaerales bacterium]
MRKSVVAGFGALVSSASVLGQVVQAPFDTSYTVTDLGTPPGVTPSFGGICFKPGDNNTLLIGGSAAAAGGAIYQIGVLRGAGNVITGWAGDAVLLSTAQNIDGGLCVIPGSGGTLLFTAWPNNSMGQVLPGGTEPAQYESLTDFGVASSTGSCQFVPAGFPGAGNLVVTSYTSGDFYILPLTASETAGLYTPGAVSASVANTGGGPEGVTYVPASSPVFGTTPSMLVCRYNNSEVTAYDVGSMGEPVVETARPFITGVLGAEGGCIDPLTGSFLFSTYGGGNRVLLVGGFGPQDCGPADLGQTGGTAGADGVLDNNDFVVFIDYFFAHNNLADMGSTGGVAGADGAWDNNDFVVFIDRFFIGCGG